MKIKGKELALKISASIFSTFALLLLFIGCLFFVYSFFYFGSCICSPETQIINDIQRTRAIGYNFNKTEKVEFSENFDGNDFEITGLFLADKQYLGMMVRKNKTSPESLDLLVTPLSSNKEPLKEKITFNCLYSPSSSPFGYFSSEFAYFTTSCDALTEETEYLSIEIIDSLDNSVVESITVGISKVTSPRYKPKY